jgi:hypothetical protein
VLLDACQAQHLTITTSLQSFPILVKPGGELGFPTEYENHLTARHTMIGQDREGYILLLVASKGNLTLHQVSTYLSGSDLDGGQSSGILLAEPSEGVPAISPLPIVITVFTR